MHRYPSVVCGGTFDRLHRGHMAFLDAVFSYGEKVTIGLTSDTYIQTYKEGKGVLPFEGRKKEVEDFLIARGYSSRGVILAIDDLYGKTLDTDAHYDAIVVTEDSLKGAKEINTKRKLLGLSPLTIVCVPLVTLSTGDTLSSSLIREGRIGREGEFFPNKKWTNRSLLLPKSLREELHQPFGEIMRGDIPKKYVAFPERIVTVGDATTKRFLEMGITPKAAVVDLVIERKKTFQNISELGFSGKEELLVSDNPSGKITPSLWEKVEEITQRLSEPKSFVLQIQGEEDLAVIPMALLLPLGFAIFYGQPHEGVIRIQITEQLKLRIFSFLMKFTSQ